MVMSEEASSKGNTGQKKVKKYLKKPLIHPSNNPQTDKNFTKRPGIESGSSNQKAMMLPMTQATG